MKNTLTGPRNKTIKSIYDNMHIMMEEIKIEKQKDEQLNRNMRSDEEKQT